MVHEKLIKERPAVVRDLVRSIAESGEWAETHRLDAAKVVSPYFRQDEKVVRFVLTKPPDRVSYRMLNPTGQEMEKIRDNGDSGVAERERIARDLHDTLLQSFQGSLLEVQAARNLIPRRLDDATQTLDEAIRSAEAAIAEGRDAILDLRSGSAARSDLAHLLAAAGQELSAAAVSIGGSHAFRVTVEGPPRDIETVLQDELYRIGREILRNAFRHARAKKIEIEIRVRRAGTPHPVPR